MTETREEYKVDGGLVGLRDKVRAELKFCQLQKQSISVFIEVPFDGGVILTPDRLGLHWKVIHIQKEGLNTEGVPKHVWYECHCGGIGLGFADYHVTKLSRSDDGLSVWIRFEDETGPNQTKGETVPKEDYDYVMHVLSEREKEIHALRHRSLIGRVLDWAKGK